jgi:hypothetical protein
MAMPLPPHEPDTTLKHALDCAACWSYALRHQVRQPQPGTLIDIGFGVQARIERQIGPSSFEARVVGRAR